MIQLFIFVFTNIPVRDPLTTLADLSRTDQRFGRLIPHYSYDSWFSMTQLAMVLSFFRTTSYAFEGRA